MKSYTIYSKNLNDSLVFYRELFNGMPYRMTHNEMCFETEHFRLRVLESSKLNVNKPYLFKADLLHLKEINNRMSRFQSIGRLKNECEVLKHSIGLIDPDGQKWIVGELNSDIHFEKCYINETTIKQTNYGTI